MFEHAVYSVISPEGCASILWRDAGKASDAATAMKLTATDLYGLGIVDRIVLEPVGGAHRDPKTAIDALKIALLQELDFLKPMDHDALRSMRRKKFLDIGG